MTVRNCGWGLLLLAAHSLLFGCATRMVVPTDGASVRTPSAPRMPPASALPAEQPKAVVADSPDTAAVHSAAPAEPPVIVALVEEADAQRAAGELENAGDALERALRIQPRNARLWQRLAQLRLAQGEAVLAADLASKSSLLAAGDVALIAENEQLIASAQAQRRDGATDRNTVP